MNKVIVTGGAGFIGSHLIDRLVSRGDQVTVLDNMSSGKLEFIQQHVDSGNVTLIDGDITDFDDDGVIVDQNPRDIYDPSNFSSLDDISNLNSKSNELNKPIIPNEFIQNEIINNENIVKFDYLESLNTPHLFVLMYPVNESTLDRLNKIIEDSNSVTYIPWSL